MSTLASWRREFPLGTRVRFTYGPSAHFQVERYCRQPAHGDCIVLRRVTGVGTDEHYPLNDLVKVYDQRETRAVVQESLETLESFKQKVTDFFVMIQREKPDVDDFCDEMWKEWVTPHLGLEKPKPPRKVYHLEVSLPPLRYEHDYEDRENRLITESQFVDWFGEFDFEDPRSIQVTILDIKDES